MKVKISVFLLGLVLFSFNALAAEPIKLGVPTPLTGAYVSDGLGYQQCIEFAVDEINANGGLLGRPLKIILFDIGDFSPEKLMQAADKLIGREKVDSAHGGWAGWGQNVRAFGKYDVPTFFADASMSSIEVYRENPKKYSNVFQMCDVDKKIAIDNFAVLEKLPYDFPNKKMALIVSDDDWGRQTGIGLEQTAKEKGWEIPMHEIVPYGNREWGTLLAKIRAHKPAIIHVEVVSPPDLMTFFRQFRKAPTNSLISYGYGLMPPDFIKNMGGEANGILGDVVFVMPLPVGPSPEANAWLKKFKAKFGNPPQAGGYLAYIGVMMWAEAVKKVGNVTDYHAINQQIAKSPYTKDPAEGIWKFDKDNKIPMTSDVPGLTVQVQGGEIVTIYRGQEKYLDYKFQVPPWIEK